MQNNKDRFGKNFTGNFGDRDEWTIAKHLSSSCGIPCRERVLVTSNNACPGARKV